MESNSAAKFELLLLRGSSTVSLRKCNSAHRAVLSFGSRLRRSNLLSSCWPVEELSSCRERWWAQPYSEHWEKLRPLWIASGGQRLCLAKRTSKMNSMKQKAKKANLEHKGGCGLDETNPELSTSHTR